MKFTTFWVVTIPGPLSTLADILFQADTSSLARQFAGGLEPEKIHAFYTGRTAETEARTAALWLLGQRDKQKGAL